MKLPIDRSGQHPSGDDVTDCGAGFVGVSENGEERANALGALDDAKGDLGGNAERAFRANETASQVVERGVKMFTADVDESRGSAGAGIGAVDEGFGGDVGSKVSAGVKARDLRTDGSFYRSLRKKYSSGRGGWKVRRGRHRWLCRWKRRQCRRHFRFEQPDLPPGVGYVPHRGAAGSQ